MQSFELERAMQGLALRAQRKASKQERLLVQSIAAAAATMEAPAPARPTAQSPGKAPGKPATQKPTVSILVNCYTCSVLLLLYSNSLMTKWRAWQIAPRFMCALAHLSNLIVLDASVVTIKFWSVRRLLPRWPAW